MKEAYDVFICFKNLDRMGRTTEDALLAHDVFSHLAAQDFRVFFSNVSLEQLGVSAYKKAIDLALDSARVLIAVGTSTENLESEWVRYEWDSFFSDMLSGVKPDARVFVYSKGIAAKDLPRSLRQSQMINHGRDSLQTLVGFVANALRSHPVILPGETVVPAEDPGGQITDDSRRKQIKEALREKKVWMGLAVEFMVTHPEESKGLSYEVFGLECARWIERRKPAHEPHGERIHRFIEARIVARH